MLSHRVRDHGWVSVTSRPPTTVCVCSVKESARTHASVCIHVCIYVCERKRELVCVFLGEVVMTHMRKQ